MNATTASTPAENANMYKIDPLQTFRQFFDIT